MKNHVAMGKHCCPVCTALHDTEVILATRYNNGEPVVPRDMQGSDGGMKDYYVTGWSPCKDCLSKFNEGYVALVGIDIAKSGIIDQNLKTTLGPADVYRTGETAWVKRDVMLRMMTDPSQLADDQRIMWVPPEVIAQLQAIMAGSALEQQRAQQQQQEAANDQEAPQADQG